MKKILTVALILITATCFAQKVTVALNLTQGNTYYMNTSAKMFISETINGQQQDINTTITGKMSFKVTQVTDTAYVMEVKMDRIGMQMQGAGQNMDFDSDKKGQQDIMSTIMGNLTNKAFSIVMTRKGKVSSVNGMDNLYSGLFDGVPNVPDDQKTQIKNQMMQSFGAKALKGNIELGTALFPDNKVAKNDQWIVNTKLESMMTANVKATFILQDISDNAYLIHGYATLATDTNSPYAELNGMPMKYNMSGTSTYEIKLDKVTGWTTDAKISQIMQGTIDIKDNPKVPGGMSIPMSLKDDQTITDK